MTPTLFDEKSFYPAFIRDLDNAQSEVIIDSPFITTERMKMMWPVLNRLDKRGVKVYIFTRDPAEHSGRYEEQSESEIEALEATNIQVLLCKGNHHRKLAIIDRQVLWEGSLNILSQIRSREIMHRLEGSYGQEMFDYLQLGRFL